MKSLFILVVEDDKNKADRIIAAVKNNGVSETDIHVAESINKARRELQLRAFDLLILDVALPRFDNERPVPDAGLSLLREITESDLYKRPSYILGVTAHEGIAETAQREFHDRLWRMLYCDSAEGGWLSAITRFVSHIGRATQDALGRRYLTDVCIVTALRYPELAAVLNIPWSWKEAMPLDETTFYSTGKAISGGREINVATACCLRMGMLSSAVLVSKMVLHLRPRILLMSGICGGIKGRVEFGDVIVGADCWSWETGKYVEGRSTDAFEPEPVSYSADEAVTARFQQMQSDHKLMAGIRGAWGGRVPSTALNLHLGPIATGSPVVARNDMVGRILSTNRKTMGIDMEAFAVHHAASAYGEPRPRIAVIKSVCDFADERKNDDWQPYAAYTSAQSIRHWVERYAAEFTE